MRELGTWHNLPLGNSGDPCDGASQPGLDTGTGSEGRLLPGEPQGWTRQFSPDWGKKQNGSHGNKFSIARGGDKLVLNAQTEHLEQWLSKS